MDCGKWRIAVGVIASASQLLRGAAIMLLLRVALMLRGCRAVEAIGDRQPKTIRRIRRNKDPC
jgi:hypothetical protein